jgi:glycosyltransferase involved in cell wall biosynthesis
VIDSVVIISSGQPSTNPRLVKEAITLFQAGYKVTVIYVPISSWADEFDVRLFHTHTQIKFIRTGYHPDQQQWLYKWARIRRKVNSFLSSFVGNNFNVADYSTILFGQELLKAAIQHKADLYIAHNLGALPAAVKAARYYNAKVGFDAEDYHRGEFAENVIEKQRTEFIENKYFSKVDYLTVASPLIGEAYKILFPGLSPVVIKNVFPVSKFPSLPMKKNLSEIHLFWFSQKVGRNRGIEHTIKALGILKDLPINFIVLGNLSAEMKSYLLTLIAESQLEPEQVKFIASMYEDELFKLASQFDIGIGGETGKDLNNDIALSNKIFTYLLAGNALILSDTKAQKLFLKEHDGVGKLYKHDNPESLASILRFYAENRDVLACHQKNARELAEKKLNWEIESKKLLDVVQAVLSK